MAEHSYLVFIENVTEYYGNVAYFHGILAQI